MIMITNNEAAHARRVLSTWYADRGDVHRSMVQLSKAIKLEHVEPARSTVTEIRDSRACGEQFHGLQHWTCGLPAGHTSLFHETPTGDRWRVRVRTH